MLGRQFLQLRLLVVWAGILHFVGRVRAHGSETTGPHDEPIAIVLFGCGVVCVSVSLFIDATRDADRRHVDAGVFIGLVAGLAGIALYWL